MVDHIESQRVFSFITFLSVVVYNHQANTHTKKGISLSKVEKRQSNGGINVNSRNELTSPWNIYKSVNEHISLSNTVSLVGDQAGLASERRSSVRQPFTSDDDNMKKTEQSWRKGRDHHQQLKNIIRRSRRQKSQTRHWREQKENNSRIDLHWRWWTDCTTLTLLLVFNFFLPVHRCCSCLWMDVPLLFIAIIGWIYASRSAICSLYMGNKIEGTMKKERKINLCKKNIKS